MDVETISVVVFFGIIGFLVYVDRKNIEFKKGILIRRTETGIKIISDVAKKYRKVLIYLGNLAVIVGIIASITGLGYMTYDTLLGRRTAAIVLPTVGSYKYPGPVFSVPFWYWIVAVFIVVSSHEPMHALFARLEKVKIKNMGIFLFFVFPLGAFADPDEKQMKRLSLIKKLRIFASGSFGNLIVAGIFILLMISYNFLVDSLITSNGVVFKKTIENTGAFEARLSGTIIEVNGYKIKSMMDFTDALIAIEPGAVIEIKTTQGIYNVKTIPHPDEPERPFIGISEPRTLLIYKGLLEGFGAVSESVLNFIYWILGLLGWVFVLNLGVGVFNLFPIKPLDGGLMFEEIIKHFYKGKYVGYVVNVISLIILSLLLTNLFATNIFFT
jgi:membrane-associated protease RseP (regulator of RpoE activity)